MILAHTIKGKGISFMPEGTVAFPQEVLLRIHTKKDEALLLETAMSMIMNHESLIATKARRVRVVAGSDSLMNGPVWPRNSEPEAYCWRRP